MNQIAKAKLSDSAVMRWLALSIVSGTMMFAYFFTDVMSPLESMLSEGLGWDANEYGFFSGAYGLMNVFLLMLFFGGIILDRMGVRFTGLLCCALMIVGASVKWYAVSHIDPNAVVENFHLDLFIIKIDAPHTSNLVAALGFSIFGIGAELAGVTVSKVISKWFTGHELALAMGVQVATARLGTAMALIFALPIAKHFGGVNASVALGAVLLCVATFAYLYY